MLFVNGVGETWRFRTMSFVSRSVCSRGGYFTKNNLGLEGAGHTLRNELSYRVEAEFSRVFVSKLAMKNLNKGSHFTV